jgi:glyoxylate reductase
VTDPRPRVLVTRVIPDAGLQLVREAADADIWDEDQPIPRDELLRRVQGVEGILALLTERIDDELLDAAGPQLRVVSNFAVGFDNIDVPALSRRGIPVGNTPGVLTDTTADLAFGLLMAAARRIPEGYDYVRAGKWTTWGPMLFLGRDVHGATLGIIGFGRIGREMARRGLGFGMRVLYHSHRQATPEVEAELHAEFVTLDRLLRESDFVSLHTNLSPETRHLIDADALARMKRTAILINTSRGPVVDHEALVDALRQGQILGAALDVTEPEPIPADHPLLSLPNALVVPHIASATHATRDRMAEMAARNLLAGVRGERLPNQVNPDVPPRR